jgi:hypothetical protein
MRGCLLSLKSIKARMAKPCSARSARPNGASRKGLKRAKPFSASKERKYFFLSSGLRPFLSPEENRFFGYEKGPKEGRARRAGLCPLWVQERGAPSFSGPPLVQEKRAGPFFSALAPFFLALHATAASRPSLLIPTHVRGWGICEN